MAARWFFPWTPFPDQTRERRSYASLRMDKLNRGSVKSGIKRVIEEDCHSLQGFDAPKENGVYGQTDAMSYWRGIGKEVDQLLCRRESPTTSSSSLPADAFFHE